MVSVIAFSKAFFVRMSRGVMPAFTSCSTASPARRQSSSLLRLSASCAELSGNESPRPSIADAIVFAVYMPPQLPGPGIALRSTSSSSAALTFPAAAPPTASNTETMSRCPSPGRIVPP